MNATSAFLVYLYWDYKTEPLYGAYLNDPDSANLQTLVTIDIHTGALSDPLITVPGFDVEEWPLTAIDVPITRSLRSDRCRPVSITVYGLGIMFKVCPQVMHVFFSAHDG